MKELEVYLNHFQKKNQIGTLALKDQKVYFQYAPNFVQKQIQLSPYSLPLSPHLKEFKNIKYGDIFGTFEDSLPDGWGLLLMDRRLRSLGYDYRGISSFDRLCFMGSTAMGALEYLPATQLSESANKQSINLYKMAQNAHAVYSGKSEEVISSLYKAGGSPGGARPKIVVIERQDGTFISHTEDATTHDKQWLIKFNVSREFQDFSSVEYFYSLMANECGVDMMPTKLFIDENNNNYFGIERFDRQGPNKIHMHSFGALIESNFRVPDQDYRNLMLVAFDLTKNLEDVYSIFRLMVFNHLTTNQDDHVKNFSFVMDEKSRWHFAPAYDLTPSFGVNGEHAMTINGKGKEINDADYLKAITGTGLNESRCKEIILEIKAGISDSQKYNCVLTKKDQKKIWSDFLKK